MSLSLVRDRKHPAKYYKMRSISYKNNRTRPDIPQQRKARSRRESTKEKQPLIVVTSDNVRSLRSYFRCIYIYMTSNGRRVDVYCCWLPKSRGLTVGIPTLVSRTLFRRRRGDKGLAARNGRNCLIIWNYTWYPFYGDIIL